MRNTEEKYQRMIWLFAKPWLTGLLTFLLLASVCTYLVFQRYTIQKNEEQRNLYSLAESVRSRLQQSLQYSLSATQTLALTIDHDGIPVNFDSVAQYILSNVKYIDALQLVPGGIIKYVYPLKENESVIGYDILRDPTRNKEANKAIEKKELFFAGPFQLRQGGLGVVGRLPVFIHNRFWGFSAVVIRVPTLFRAAGIDTSGASGYYYQLSKINPDTNKEEFFLPNRKKAANSYEVAISVPDGEWKLSVAPVNGYRSLQASIPLGIFGLILSILGGIFASYGSRIPARLQQLVQERTAELDKSQKRNKAIVDALPDMAIVIDAQGQFADYANPMEQATLLPPEKFMGKKVKDIMPHPLADEILVNIQKVLALHQVLSHSYQLEIAGELRAFEARYAPQGKEDVLVLIRDVTDMKKSEQLIKESEEKYRTLVEEAADAIFIANFNGEFLVVNPAGSRISLYTQQELLTMRMHELMLPEDLKVMPFKFDELAAGKTATSERSMIRKDGKLIYVEVIAKIIAPDRFLAFVRDISERKKVESELLKSREDLRHLSNYIENVREQERLHISREIHDELGQLLTVLKMDVSRMTKNNGFADIAVQHDIENIQKAINNMVNVVRRISTELRPGLLDDLGLLAALDWYCHEFENRTGIQTFFITNITEENLSKNLNIGIFRIFQESLTNVARHAEAAKVDTSLVRQGNHLILLIEDNGKGFEEAAVRDQKTLGIMGMKERAILMGGSYTIHSKPGKGTVAEVIIPLPADS